MAEQSEKAAGSQSGGGCARSAGVLNILVCDDEAAFAEKLVETLTSLPDYTPGGMRVRCVTDPADMPEMDLAPYDLVFLDVDMGPVDGLALARRMRAVCPDAVLIFVTNFIEYAPDGYEVNAFRYLAKAELADRLPRYFSEALALCRQKRRDLPILCRGEMVPVPVQSLVYVEGLGHEQCLHLQNTARPTLYTRKTMAELERLLAPFGFLRVHKSYLVNMAFLQKLQSTGAGLATGEVLPVSARSYRENHRKFMSWMVRQL